MHPQDWAQLLFFILALVSLTYVAGTYISHIFTEPAPPKFRFLNSLEKICYRIGNVDAEAEMSWVEYGKALLLFNAIGLSFLFAVQAAQIYLPMNPQKLLSVPWTLALNTAISFTTNTDWQAAPGESTFSGFVQMIGFTSMNFLSAATGMATFAALTRGLTRKTTCTIGNFWKDLVRTTVYLLLPLATLIAFILVSEGVVQTFDPNIQITTLENRPQIIPLGPVASQEAIKQLGTNGGGFFNTNSAHPFENPSALTNWIEMVAIVLIPAASIYAYGLMIGSKRHAWILFSAVLFLWGIGLGISSCSERIENPQLGPYPLLEGKETRLGITNSLLWASSTTATANGSTNASMSSLSPLSGGIAMFNMMAGEQIFGGMGVGLCSLIMFTLLTVFLSGLMVGRTPEYLGKKIERREVQWVTLSVLLPSVLILIGSAISCSIPAGIASTMHQGPHGLSEILYAFSSAAANNGSAFAGLNANTAYYNIILGAVMLLGRTAIILPSLAIAGAFAQKKITPPSAGTFSTNSPLFAALLISSILVIGALTFFPALSLGPIIEQLLMLNGRAF